MPVHLRADHLPRRARLRAVRPRPTARSSCTTRCAAGDAACSPVGLKALASLRMEKAYRDFGHDIDNTDCPLEVGLGFARRVGHRRSAARTRAAAQRKAAVPVDPAAGADPAAPTPSRCCTTPSRCSATARSVGYVRAASYGWTLGAAVGLAIRRAATRRSPRTGSTPAPGRSTSPASGTPPRSRCGRCTTRPAPGCAADPRDVIEP